MRVAVFGTTGMLGNYVYLWLKEQGYDVYSINRDELDASSASFSQVSAWLNCGDWDAVVNCMGIIKQKADEVSEYEMIAVNTMFPHLIQSCINKMPTLVQPKFIHISTDCVFSGLPNHKRLKLESTPPDAKDLYGRSKALGEPSQATVIRTSIIGSEKKSKKSLLEWVKSKNNQECDGYVDHHWNGVTCLQLAKFIDYIIKNDAYWTGVKHYTSPHTISKFGLIRCIAHAYSLNIKVNSAYGPQMRDMTLASSYPSTFPPQSIPEQLDELVEFDRKNNLI